MVIKITSNAQEILDGMKAELDAYRAGLQSQVFRSLSYIQAAAINNLRGASGLHVRSGSLLNSIYTKMDESSGGYITGEVGSAGVPYAAIHEFGGTTKAHDIRPRVKKALKFSFGGKDVFAKVVHHPGSKIPARPYLGPALEAERERILNEFGLFIQASFASKG